MTGLVAVSLALMVTPMRYTARLGDLVRPVMAPLGSGTVYITTHIRSRTAELLGGGAIPSDVEPLLVAMQQTIRSQQEEIDSLRHWQRELNDFPCKLIPARVIGGESNPSRNRRTVDSGRRDGVGAGDLVSTRRLLHQMKVALPQELFVLGRNYLVGKIIDSAAHTATLQLVTDARFQSQAMLWRMIEPGGSRDIFVDGPGGAPVKKTITHDGRTPSAYPIGEPKAVLAEGNGAQIVLRHVPAQYNVRAGDLLTTPEQTRLLVPFGLTIGKVVSTQSEPAEANFVTVFVQPLADLNALEDVYIVLPINREPAKP